MTDKIHLRQAQRAIWHDNKLSTVEKHVGVYMLNRMNDAFANAYPSIATICRDLDMHRATVLRALDHLVSVGWFEKKQAPGTRGVRAYSVHDIEVMIDLATQHANFERSRRATGRTQRQVAQDDMSPEATSTCRTGRHVPVAQDDTDRLKGSAHRSAKRAAATGEAQNGPSEAPLLPPTPFSPRPGVADATKSKKPERTGRDLPEIEGLNGKTHQIIDDLCALNVEHGGKQEVGAVFHAVRAAVGATSPAQVAQALADMKAKVARGERLTTMPVHALKGWAARVTLAADGKPVGQAAAQSPNRINLEAFRRR